MSRHTLTTVLDDRILTLHGQRVLLDADLARLYGVSTKAFNQAVKRNAKRFPSDFRFRLTAKEASSLRSQIVTSNKAAERGGRRHLPWAFTQEGVAMLSGILNSPRAAAVNIAIMRAFVRMRRTLAEHSGVLARLDALEEGLKGQNTTSERNFRVVFETLRRLLDEQDDTVPARVGFRLNEAGGAYSVARR
jgi:hypothetical protein